MMDNDNQNIIADLKNRLFKTAQYLGKDVLKESVRALHGVLKCSECSLWSINHNSTRQEKESQDFISTSLICRELSSSVSYNFHQKDDFVHDLKNCLFGQVFNAQKTDNPFFRIPKEKATNHRSKDFVEKLELTDFIVFPIFKKDIDNTVIALLEISNQDSSIDDSVLKQISSIILPFFSAAFARDSFVQKQSITHSLTTCHRFHRNQEAPKLFKNIIDDVLMKACPAQGISIFVWDTYQNRYNLVATTGLEGDPNPADVYYQMGEGRTGTVGRDGKPLVTDDIKRENQENTTIGKHREILKDEAQTEMYIPIKDPSRQKDVIGVFRMVNKKNVCDDKFVDFFNDCDVEIMEDVAEYLALIIANYQKEEERCDFIDKLTHEIVTPANAIWKTASRLYKRLNDNEFLNQYLSPYLKNIIDFAEMQRWQASTNLFLSRNRRRQPFDVRYSIQPTLLSEVINDSISIVRPIARKYEVPFSNIYINSKSDKFLRINIDKSAFVTIFYNLFTNAIKYHDPNAKNQFYIEVKYSTNQDSLVIEVIDNGIGINPEEKSKIFETGYRSESAIRINATGYGIGLTVTKQIIEDFGGNISITNNKKPTIFQISIPKNKIV